MRTYSEEENEFLKSHSYIEDVIDGHHLRYVLSGAENTQAIRGSHHGPWVLQDEYISKISSFLGGL